MLRLNGEARLNRSGNLLHCTPMGGRFAARATKCTE